MTVHDLKISPPGDIEDKVSQPSAEQAEEAVRVLLRWAGDDPRRAGLIETPKRVVAAYKEWFRGYNQDPEKILNKTFDEVEGYSDWIVLKDIGFQSFCEHHLAPIVGKAHVAYLPTERVVGISKLARLVDAFSKRLQIQERLTIQIAKTLDQTLKPKGVAVVVEAEHHCMCTRGVNKNGVSLLTSSFLGEAEKDREFRKEFLNSVG
jgi:GTP cyclohydrolase I